MARGAAAAAGPSCASRRWPRRRSRRLRTASGEGPRWFQLYWSTDRGVVKDLLDRAAASGFSAVVLTVDLPELGRRERDLRTGFEIPEEIPVPIFLALAESVGAISPDGHQLGGRRVADLARPRVAPLGLVAAAPREGDPHGRGRGARSRVRRGRRRRLQPRRPAAGRRGRGARRAARGRRGGRRPRGRAHGRRCSPRYRRRQGARARSRSGPRRSRAALGPGRRRR